MSQNIKVVCRVRPFNKAEQSAQQASNPVNIVEGTTVITSGSYDALSAPEVERKSSSRATSLQPNNDKTNRRQSIGGITTKGSKSGGGKKEPNASEKSPKVVHRRFSSVGGSMLNGSFVSSSSSSSDGASKTPLMSSSRSEEAFSQFNFDKAFDTTAQQEDVFAEVGLPILNDVMDGYNCTIFAYGQTGSGKTYTMMGQTTEESEWALHAGIIPRLEKRLFEMIDEADADIEFTVKISIVEIYLEKIRDLLNVKQDNLRVREGKDGEVYIEDLSELYVCSAQEAMDVLEAGNANRSIGCTNMNEKSSRSHSCVIMTVFQRNSNTGEKKNAKLTLVDLAGSEKVAKSGAEGHTLKEAQHINKSLSALGNVINGLSSGQGHIPYRDSKLTRLLTDSLGGNSKTCLIVTCSPSQLHLDETIGTLRFGKRAKNIKNKPVQNRELSAQEYKALWLECKVKNEADTLTIEKLEAALTDARRATAGGGDLNVTSSDLANVSIHHDVSIVSSALPDITDLEAKKALGDTGFLIKLGEAQKGDPSHTTLPENSGGLGLLAEMEALKVQNEALSNERDAQTGLVLTESQKLIRVSVKYSKQQKAAQSTIGIQRDELTLLRQSLNEFEGQTREMDEIVRKLQEDLLEAYGDRDAAERGRDDVEREKEAVELKLKETEEDLELSLKEVQKNLKMMEGIVKRERTGSLLLEEHKELINVLQQQVDALKIKEMERETERELEQESYEEFKRKVYLAQRSTRKVTNPDDEEEEGGRESHEQLLINTNEVKELLDSADSMLTPKSDAGAKVSPFLETPASSSSTSSLSSSFLLKSSPLEAPQGYVERKQYESLLAGLRKKCEQFIELQMREAALQDTLQLTQQDLEKALAKDHSVRLHTELKKVQGQLEASQRLCQKLLLFDLYHRKGGEGLKGTGITLAQSRRDSEMELPDMKLLEDAMRGDEKSYTEPEGTAVIHQTDVLAGLNDMHMTPMADRSHEHRVSSGSFSSSSFTSPSHVRSLRGGSASSASSPIVPRFHISPGFGSGNGQEGSPRPHMHTNSE